MKTIEFKGKRYTRDDKTGYYLNSTNKKRLHRAVWEFYRGDIPVGYHIHHIDHDKNNNSIDNLEMISAVEHARHHGLLRDTKEMLKLAKVGREFAKEWHASKDGRKWHREHYENMKHKLHKKVDLSCEYCSVDFTGEVGSKFCSNKCKSAYRRKLGIDNIDVICDYCGKGFTKNKYSKTKTCSRSCANYARNKTTED